MTALHWAVDRKNADLLNTLIEAGADLNIKDKYDKTALDYATGNKCAEIAKILTAVEALKGDDPNFPAQCAQEVLSPIMNHQNLTPSTSPTKTDSDPDTPINSNTQASPGDSENLSAPKTPKISASTMYIAPICSATFFAIDYWRTIDSILKDKKSSKSFKDKDLKNNDTSLKQKVSSYFHDIKESPSKHKIFWIALSGVCYSLYKFKC